MASLEEKQTSVSTDMSEYKFKIQTVEQNLTSMEALIQKENLKCHALKSSGSVEETVKQFLIDSLKIPAEAVCKMEMVCCFRIGKQDPSKDNDTRTILVTFIRSSDVTTIKAAARKKNQGVPGGIQEDLQ